MRKYFQSLALILCFSKLAVAQQGFEIVHDFCDDGRVTSSAFSAYTDTNFFLVTGPTSTLNVSPEHSYLAAYDYSGSMLWNEKLLFPGFYNSSQSYRGIIKLNETKYLFLGSIYENNYNVWYPYLYMFNKKGDSLFYKSYPDTANRRYITSALRHGNNIVAAGGVQYISKNKGALWLSKYDTSGNLIWQKEYLRTEGIPYNDNIVLSTDSLHYLIVGPMADTVTGPYDFKSCMLKIDTAGNIIWIKSLTKKSYRSYDDMDVVTNPSGGYYFVSSISLSATQAPDSSFIYYGKLDEQGDTLWTKTFRENFNNCMGYQIKWDNDKHHLVMLTGPNSGTLSGCIRIDTVGNVLWYSIPKHLIAGKPWLDDGIMHNISVTPDNRYLMTGYADTTIGTLSWMILTDSNGCRFPDDPNVQPLSIKQNISANNNVDIYPNPVLEQLMVAGIEAGSTLQLLDVYGRTVYSTTTLQTKITINTSRLANGNYLLQLTDVEGGRIVRKVVKE